ncbi:3492_t:CDS:2 [Diversispora eburnea]|uniref:3492_t:CDS:1 n=1 Tax=Diversispora eburnea TaxID=1213867 RepID=A0A9N9AEF6_9GLOM|nr:3492_t:CDS:2 [Diversispora eburnea]
MACDLTASNEVGKERSGIVVIKVIIPPNEINANPNNNKIRGRRFTGDELIVAVLVMLVVEMVAVVAVVAVVVMVIVETVVVESKGWEVVVDFWEITESFDLIKNDSFSSGNCVNGIDSGNGKYAVVAITNYIFYYNIRSNWNTIILNNSNNLTKKK